LGNIIPLHGNPHSTTQELLPWYVNGTLDAHERRIVDEHLLVCAECRADLESERQLANAFVGLMDEAMPDPPARLPVPPADPVRARGPFRAMGTPMRFALIAASQLLIVAASVSFYAAFTSPAPSAYHALSAPVTQAPAGNVIAIFRPDVSEQMLRATLRLAGARIVDGPTAADAYILSVPADRLDTALASLRAQPAVVLVQPIGTDKSR
jgi:hypothetical protein